MRKIPLLPFRARLGLRRGALLLVILGFVLALGNWVGSHRTHVIFEGDSDFGHIRVVERADGLRSLYTGAGKARQSAVFPGRPRHLEIAYTRLGMVGLALIPEDARILFVGLGGGAMPMYARAAMPRAHIDVVEIDPLIVFVARQYFGFQPDSQLVVYTADGRDFIEQATWAAYDLIILDAFGDDEIPLSLATRQFLQSVRERLAPRGAVVSNLWSSSRQYEAMLATYNAVFGNIHLLQVPGQAQRILIAPSEGRVLSRAGLIEATRLLAHRVDLGFDLPRMVEEGYERAPESNAPVLDDRQLSEDRV
jgi:spermidine synthase